MKMKKTKKLQKTKEAEIVKLPCSGGSCKNQTFHEHTCPYQVEINGNDEFTCTCCSDCEHECAMDI